MMCLGPWPLICGKFYCLKQQEMQLVIFCNHLMWMSWLENYCHCHLQGSCHHWLKTLKLEPMQSVHPWALTTLWDEHGSGWDGELSTLRLRYFFLRGSSPSSKYGRFHLAGNCLTVAGDGWCSSSQFVSLPSYVAGMSVYNHHNPTADLNSSRFHI